MRALLALAVLLPGQAMAQDCPHIRLADLFQPAPDGVARALAIGTVRLDDGQMVLLRGRAGEVVTHDLPARFDGRIQDGEALGPEVSIPLTVALRCESEICGHLPEESPGIMVIDRRPEPAVLSVGLCPARVAATPDTIFQAETCLAHGCRDGG